MATLDLGPMVRKVMQEQLEKFKEDFKEEIRILQDEAWKQGYLAAEFHKDKSTNPYRKEPQ